MNDHVSAFCWNVNRQMKINGWSLTDLSRTTGLSMGTLGKLFKRGQYPSLRTAVRICLRVGISLDHILMSFTEKTETGYRVRRLLSQSGLVRGDVEWIQLGPGDMAWNRPELREYYEQVQYETGKAQQDMEKPPELRAMTGTRQEAINVLQSLLLSLDDNALHFWVITLQHYISTHRRDV